MDYIQREGEIQRNSEIQGNKKIGKVYWLAELRNEEYVKEKMI